MSFCRCDGTDLGTVDHCGTCGCEEFEERCATAGTYDRDTGRKAVTILELATALADVLATEQACRLLGKPSRTNRDLYARTHEQRIAATQRAQALLDCLR